MDAEEPDYEALWQRIVASAEQEIERQKRQAGWLEAAGVSFNADLFHAAQRRASKAFIRRAWQQYDLAAAIGTDDIAGYIDRWYPTKPPPNGPRITFVSRDEYVEGFVKGDARILVYEESEDDDATVWRTVGGGTAWIEYQAGSHLQDGLPAQHAGWLHTHVRSFPRRAYAWTVRNLCHCWPRW